jgi:hypothetical protein
LIKLKIFVAATSGGKPKYRHSRFSGSRYSPRSSCLQVGSFQSGLIVTGSSLPKLRQHGIDAWFDEWEIGPGDSLVSRIFEEGLKNAEVVIVVISAASVQKRWVREELNASVIKRLEGSIKLIPVVIDDCDIPEALTDILHVRIADVNDYGAELDRIVNAILGTSGKPPLGKVPAFTKPSSLAIPGLYPADQHVMEIVCELSLTGDTDVLTPGDVAAHAKQLGMSEKQVRESIPVLGEQGYLHLSGALGTYAIHFRIASRAFELYCRSQVQSYDSIVRAVAAQILNKGQHNSLRIAEELRQPRLLVNHIMNDFAARGFCKKSGEIGTHVSVYDISPQFRRAFEG